MSIKATSQVSLTDVTDAYSVTLTSEAYTFIGDTIGAPAGLSCETQAVAYRGTEKCSNVAISSVACPSGISSEISNNNTASPTITFTTTAIIEDSCEATIDIVVDEVEFTKKFSFAVAKEGSFPDDWYADADKTYINGSEIYTGSITSEQLNTNSIKSRNYIKGKSGTFLNLEDGTFDSPNFKLNSNGDGRIGCWKIMSSNTNPEDISNGFFGGNQYYTSIITMDTISLFSSLSKHRTVITPDNLLAYSAETTELKVGTSATIGYSGATTANLTCYGTVNASTLNTDNIICRNYLQVGSPSDDNRSISWVNQNRNVWAGFANSNSGWFIFDATHKTTMIMSDPSGNNVFFGELVMPNNRYIYGTNTAGSGVNLIGINNSNNVHVGSYGFGGPVYIHGGDGNTEYQLNFNAARFGPSADNKITLGYGSHRWKQLIAGTTTISTSDRNLKDDIQPLSDKYIDMLLRLEPVSFKFKDGDSGRTHVGFISQDVEEIMGDIGLTDLDFAGFCKDRKMEEILDENGDLKEEVPVIDNNGDPVYIYSLRYEEFIAINTKAIKMLYDRVNELEKKLANQ